ncbi:DUF2335 domain-containing protein [Fructobacillus sp. CRL 2054]|uniref:DUF2335 domain-containing protein n=1 Tax=Fructobacillus sp. CRL 2054 TaxID=2763007 RepID=UPI0023796D99|nr:DUF2335 domain-containing protein [Fructobacillus sp. CRL 2054]MDD9138667.1 DUF2335 domain-containing protein [Fructobacillus sp. CRL 2054]
MANKDYIVAQKQKGDESLSVSKGPIPNPEVLEKIEKLAPGSTEKIIKDTIVESEHRRHLEMLEQQKYWKFKAYGHLTALLIALAMIAATFGLVYLEHPVAGSIFGTATFLSAIGIFMDGSSKGK